jgi:hypothetical protein
MAAGTKVDEPSQHDCPGAGMAEAQREIPPKPGEKRIRIEREIGLKICDHHDSAKRDPTGTFGNSTHFLSAIMRIVGSGCREGCRQIAILPVLDDIINVLR